MPRPPEPASVKAIGHSHARSTKKTIITIVTMSPMVTAVLLAAGRSASPPARWSGAARTGSGDGDGGLRRFRRGGGRRLRLLAELLHDRGRGQGQLDGQ